MCESLLTHFYRATQKADEDTTSWGCRLEDLISKAIDKRKVHQAEAGGMLKTSFGQEFVKTSRIYLGIFTTNVKPLTS
jgi:hypothetical protein